MQFIKDKSEFRYITIYMFILMEGRCLLTQRWSAGRHGAGLLVGQRSGRAALEDRHSAMRQPLSVQAAARPNSEIPQEEQTRPFVSTSQQISPMSPVRSRVCMNLTPMMSPRNSLSVARGGNRGV